MDMRDKDLDKLFQSALNDYETEPSAKVWTGIAGELDAGKRKKVWLPLLSIAAGIALLITAGVLFIPKEVKPTKPDVLAAVKPTVVAPQTPATQPTVAQNNKPANVAMVPANNLANNKTKTHKRGIIKPVIIQPAQDMIIQDEQLVLASAKPDQQPIKPVLPDMSIPITEKHIEDQPTMTNAPVTASAQVAAAKPAVPAKKHKIRSLGDVFNVMIAAVDKRKDKIIEFSNTDEDDATITGVNLGIIKVKKEK